MKDIRSMLSRGEGIKVLLLDDFAKSAITPLIPHSELLSYDFFLFENIRQAERPEVAASCVAVLEKDTLPLLYQELEQPKYKEYFLFITSALSKSEIREIAERDKEGIVRELQELYLGSILVDQGLFVTQQGSPKESANGLVRTLKGLGLCPRIRYAFGSGVSYLTAEMLTASFDVQSEEEVSEEDNKQKEEKIDNCNSELLIIDRVEDLFTPIQYPWTYQSMAGEYLEHLPGMIRWINTAESGGSGITSTVSASNPNNLNNPNNSSSAKTSTSSNYEMLILSQDDEFFAKNKYQDIVSAADALKKALKLVKSSREAIGEFAASLRRRARESEQLIMHLKAISEISRRCQKNDVAAEIIYDIIEGNIPTDKTISELTKEQEIRAGITEYLIRMSRDKTQSIAKRVIWGDKKKIEGSSLITKHMRKINAFTEVFPVGKREVNVPSFCKEEDRKMGYIPVVATLARKLKEGVLSKRRYPCMKDGRVKKVSAIVVYIFGGVTLIEYRALKILFANKYPDTECILIGDRLITGKEIVKKVIEKVPSMEDNSMF